MVVVVGMLGMERTVLSSLLAGLKGQLSVLLLSRIEGEREYHGVLNQRSVYSTVCDSETVSRDCESVTMSPRPSWCALYSRACLRS